MDKATASAGSGCEEKNQSYAPAILANSVFTFSVPMSAPRVPFAVTYASSVFTFGAPTLATQRMPKWVASSTFTFLPYADLSQRSHLCKAESFLFKTYSRCRFNINDSCLWAATRRFTYTSELFYFVRCNDIPCYICFSTFTVLTLQNNPSTLYDSSTLISFESICTYTVPA